MAGSILYCLLTVFTTAAALAGCTDFDATPRRPESAGYVVAVANTPPPGFAMLMLVPTDSPAPMNGHGRHGPVGAFWYRITSPSDGTSPVLEWYVRAQHLTPTHAYRAELQVDDHATYAVGSARTDRFGEFTIHGSLSRFEDRYCVGQPTVPISLTGQHLVSVRIKADGSGSGGAGSVMDPERMLDCDGNGDGVFNYWLVSRDEIHLGGTQTAAR